MTVSKTSKISAILSATACAIAIAVVACPGGGGGSGKSSAKLVSVAVTPSNPTIALGTTRQFIATGTFSDGKSTDLTSTVAWTSSDPAAGTISTTLGTRGLATGLGLGTTTISAIYNGKSGSTTLTVSSADLLSIQVTPTNPHIALGTNEEFAATGMFTDGSTQDLTEQVVWESSATSASTISNDAMTHGVAHTVGLGDTTIKATLSGVNGTTTLTVTSAVLVSLEITPTNPSIAMGTSQPFAATGTFSDGTMQDLTEQVSWNSSTANVLVSNDAGTHGLAESVSVGSATISASHAGVFGSTTMTVSSATLASLAVTPVLPVLPLGTTQAFTATGTFTDGSVQDVTTQVTWSSSEPLAATIANASGQVGVASTIALGNTTISAQLSGKTGSTTLSVSNATLASIDVTPSHPSVALGTTQAFTATGIYTDHSTQDLTDTVTWTSSSPTVATVSNADGSRGLATTVAVGNTTITATLASKSGTTSFTVSSAALVAIAVSPDVAALARGTSQAFTALGVLTDGTHQDLTEQVTWSSTDSATATVSNADGTHGFVIAVDIGNVTISATFMGVTGTSAVQVSGASLTSIDVFPFVTSIASGTEVQFSAIGNFSDDSSQDLTTQVTWSTSNAAVAAISNADGSQGLVTGTGVGTATITATLSGVSEPVDLSVTNALLDSIQLMTDSLFVPTGSNCTILAIGFFSDGTSQDITDLATWSSSNVDVATISNASDSKGFVHSMTGGTTQITATHLGKSVTATLTVTTATLVSITVTPVNQFVPAGYSLSLQAVGNYSDATTRNLNAEVLWSSSNPSVATISNSAGTGGRVTGVASGTTTVTATLPAAFGTTTLTVTPEILNSIVVEPASVTVVIGGTRQVTATGYFSGGSVLDLTSVVKWLATPRSVASVGNSLSKGLVTARKVGGATIRAKKDGKTGTAGLSVSGL